MSQKRRSRRSPGTDVATPRGPNAAAVCSLPPDRGATIWHRSSTAADGRSPVLRFVAIFAGGLCLYFLLTLTIEFQDSTTAAQHPVISWLIAANQTVRRTIVTPYQQTIATMTARAVNLLGYHTTVEGREIRSQEFAVEITGGCDAIELTLLLAAAIVAFPASVPRKLVGLAAGVVAIAGLNYVRVVSLWVIGVHWPTAFDVAHFSVWPFALICAAMLFFVAWLRYASPAPRAPDHSP